MGSKQRKTQLDDKYETEEYFVYVDLDTKLLDDQLSKSKAKIKFLGIDTENPIMQINNQLFKGIEKKSVKIWTAMLNYIHKLYKLRWLRIFDGNALLFRGK